jgi:hypothetical protein
MQPTYMDHYYLNFWLWACLHDAEAYLESSRRFTSSIPNDPKDWATFLQKERPALQRTTELNKYHFIMTMGSLEKNHPRLAELFQSVQPTYEAAEHFRKEGLYLRNMVEHGDKNLQAANKGTPRGGFVRKSNLLPELPGSSGGLADATSTIINDEGHWLGGRLNVEKIIEEVRLIYNAAQAIPPPYSSGLPASP